MYMCTCIYTHTNQIITVHIFTCSDVVCCGAKEVDAEHREADAGVLRVRHYGEGETRVPGHFLSQPVAVVDAALA